ncbi:MAG: hypothetical protein D6696_15280 [Acidobacteria bacterium]|nr:MAG: hypothetical protein D6696_15280 [Acidobacteriota bacterium]
MRGWPIVGWAAVGLSAMVLVVFLLHGTGEEGLRRAVRATARTSVSLFLLAFAASSLRRLWPLPFTAWLLANRRYVGVSFAVSHAIHLAAILALARVVPAEHALLPTAELIGGILAYVALGLMTATSFDRTAAWLGPRRWRLLHRVSAYFLWLIFALNYVGGAFVNPVHLPFAAAVLGVLALRIAARCAPPPRPVPARAA